MPRPRGWIDRFRRALRFKFLVPIVRSPHPPEYTARGVAAGLFWGTIPLLGLQTGLAFATWWVARRVRRELSLVQALLWQWINNPLTTLPLYYLFFETGELMFGRGVTGYADFVTRWNETQASGEWIDRAIAAARMLGTPTLVGSLPWALVFATSGYLWSLAMIKRRRARVTRRAPVEPPS